MKAGANGSAPGKLAEQVYETLKEQIHDFKLVAGDRFSEAELGARLGMSRTPVREALFRLRNEGFLGVESKLGWHVLPIDFGRLEQLCASSSSWRASRACALAPTCRPASRR
jgi:DNA-binding GntR family transcriptional regulator